MKTVRFVTLGCKVNQYETQAMRESLLKAGCEEASEGPFDVVVVNTCTVTEEADRGNRYWIRRLRRENPGARVVVTGCWVERNRKEIEALPGIDLILNNREKETIAEHLFQGCATPEVQDGEAVLHSGRTRYGRQQISTFQGYGRAFVKIQDGCNHACSFCKVVLVRGRFRSRPLASIVEEAGRLSEAGFREVVLTGIQLGAYGTDQRPNLDLVSVLEALDGIEGIERIRLSSIEPTDVKPDLVRSMKKFLKVCPQLHIPLQSGDDALLERMNRRYQSSFYRELIRELRRNIPDFCLSLDVMVGFPGEEDAHFENTLRLLEEVRPIRVHVFPYSRRAGTLAARLVNVPASVLRNRMERILDFTKEIVCRERQRFLGRVVPVLVEKHSFASGLCQGHTPHYLKVYFKGSDALLGKTASVRLTEGVEDGLIGKPEEN